MLHGLISLLWLAPVSLAGGGGSTEPRWTLALTTGLSPSEQHFIAYQRYNFGPIRSGIGTGSLYGLRLDWSPDPVVHVGVELTAAPRRSVGSYLCDSNVIVYDPSRCRPDIDGPPLRTLDGELLATIGPRYGEVRPYVGLGFGGSLWHQTHSTDARQLWSWRIGAQRLRGRTEIGAALVETHVSNPPFPFDQPARFWQLRIDVGRRW